MEKPKTPKPQNPKTPSTIGAIETTLAYNIANISYDVLKIDGYLIGVSAEISGFSAYVIIFAL